MLRRRAAMAHVKWGDPLWGSFADPLSLSIGQRQPPPSVPDVHADDLQVAQALVNLNSPASAVLSMAGAPPLALPGRLSCALRGHTLSQSRASKVSVSRLLVSGLFGPLFSWLHPFGRRRSLRGTSSPGIARSIPPLPTVTPCVHGARPRNALPSLRRRHHWVEGSRRAERPPYQCQVRHSARRWSAPSVRGVAVARGLPCDASLSAVSRCLLALRFVASLAVAAPPSVARARPAEAGDWGDGGCGGGGGGVG